MRDYTVKEALLIDYNIKGKDAEFSRTSYTVRLWGLFKRQSP